MQKVDEGVGHIWKLGIVGIEENRGSREGVRNYEWARLGIRVKTKNKVSVSACNRSVTIGHSTAVLFDRL